MGDSINEQQSEVASGKRFAFGKNWQRFLAGLGEEQLLAAEASLKTRLETDGLAGKTFLDAGCGSGLFSLAALRLGAARVHSFDYDPDSVACAEELRRRYAADADRWTIEGGSVLDVDYLGGLGMHDVVYSWGVLHHTGEMWTALGNLAPMVEPSGSLVVSIYSDQGGASRVWRRVKQIHNRLPSVLRVPFVVAVMAPFEVRSLALLTLTGHPLDYGRAWRRYGAERGMSRWIDMVDWVGGYPFEVAEPGAVFAFYRDRGFVLTRLTTVRGRGCNEFVFRRAS